jgi:hypothetical protein
MKGSPKPYEHHVLGGIGRLAHHCVEDLFRHVRFRLFVRLARAHRAVQVALGGGLDDVLDGQARQSGAPRQVSPQEFCPVPGPHESSR